MIHSVELQCFKCTCAVIISNKEICLFSHNFFFQYIGTFTLESTRTRDFLLSS
jgi:hypothetical protein